MWTNKFRKIISFLMAVAIMFSWIPVEALEVEQKATDSIVSTNALLGKTLSILGDSISTFSNYSNGTASQTTNSTIAGGAIYYPRSGFDVTAENTWWYQAAQMLGMEILVNNSWSGSCLLNTRSGTVGAYVDRCVQLHDDTGENAGQKPDIIAIFLGTNDYYTYPGTLGSYEAIDFGTLITEAEDGFAYAEPTTSLEAYAISLHKISQAYPDAEVYCFTLLPRINSTNQPTAFNADVCQLAQHFGVYTVDLYDCGIRSDSGAFYMLMGDSLHPDVAGMDAITNAFVSAVLKNSGLATFDVTFALEGAVAMDGTSRTVVSGDAFEATLAPLDASLPLEVTVTMSGADITENCCKGNVVTIPTVTGEVVITAKPGQREPMNFRWETRDDAFDSVTTGNNQENPLTMTHGTITDGTFSKTRFTMNQGISLRHDLPWCVEWKSSGTWTDTTDGALLFAEASSSTTVDTCYFYRRHNNDFFAFGSYTGGKYHNYGVKFAGTGIDTTAEHVFRMENHIAEDGTNMIWLLVDGVEVGPMNAHYIGGTDQKETVDWVSGKDFNFSYMGTSPHTIGGCSLEYIQVWEAGAPEETRELTSFRWEYDAGTDSFVNVTHSGNTENPLTMTHGTITDGTFAKTRFTLTDTVMLNHDSPWSLEWKASGSWTDTTDGALLFAEANASATENCAYLYRRHQNTWFALGIYENGQYHNYAAKISGTGIDTTEEHVYRLTNRIADDGSNMVYLYVDGVEIGPMNQYYIAGTYQNKTVDWVCGKDFRFSYMGTTPHTIGGGTLDYVQVWEKGIPCSHSYTAQVTLPTCTEQGYTTYRCACGDSYVDDYVDATGHDYAIDAAVSPTCTETGLTEGSHCEVCGEVLVAQEEVEAAGHHYENGICSRCSSTASPYLQQLPEYITGCSNLYDILTPSKGYYTATQYDTSNGAVLSVVIPVEPGDRIAASSFGPVSENMGSVDGIRVTYLLDGIIVKSLSASSVYNTYTQNGYLTVPEGVNMVSVPWWAPSDNNWLTLSQISKNHAVHSPTTVPAQAPTCTQVGYTEGTKCELCSLVLEGCQEIPKTAHNYENHFCTNCGLSDGGSPYLQPLPADFLGCENLYTNLTPIKGYYTATKYLEEYLSVVSVVIPVEPGDRIAASSFGPVSENMGSVNGIRVTYLLGDKIVTSLSAEDVYNGFTKNGYITVPDGVDAVCIPWWAPSDSNWLTLAQISKNYAAHSPKTVPAQAPTCTKNGYTAGEICGVCDASLGTRVEIPATGHDYSGNTCTICGTVNALAFLDGKYVSVLGDSISTFNGYSNDATVNSSIGGNGHRYDAGTADTKPGSYCLLESVDHTWWMHFANRSGMKLLVNNSWAGSQVFGGQTSDGRQIPPAYLERCINLHDNTIDNNPGNAPINPDVIFVYLGINDYNFNRNNVGNGAVDYAKLVSSDGTYVTPTTFGEAYGILLHKMQKAYPNAQIFAMTLLPENLYSVDMTAWAQHNAYIRAAAEYYDVPLVDLAENCVITWENYSGYMIDKIHPTTAGMELISDCIEKELLAYYKENPPHVHTPVVDPAVDTTCTETGLTEGSHCGTCGKVLVAQDEIPAVGHSYTDGICTLCGIVQTSTFEILDMRCNRTETFTYEVGMTWREWLNSKYNTGMGSCIAIWVSAGPNIPGSNPYMDIWVNGALADYNDVIREEDELTLIRYQ